MWGAKKEECKAEKNASMCVGSNHAGLVTIELQLQPAPSALRVLSS